MTDTGPVNSIPALTTSLTRHGLLAADSTANWHGPRRWWGGPLDVEGLTLASVGLAAHAVDELVGSPGAASVDSRSAAAAFNSLGHLRVDGRQPEGFAELSGFFATADGWIRTHGNYPHHGQRLRDTLGAQTRDDVAHALCGLGADEAEQRITDAGGIAAAVHTRAQWVAAATVPVATPDTWIDVAFAPLPPGHSRTDVWSPSASAVRPLTGLRVLDLTRVIAGPTATRVLAALGADVLRVDPPQTPELLDQHIDTGFGKRTTTADLTDPASLAAVRSLLDEADVMVIGYRNDSLRRFGLAPDQLRASHPHLVVVSLDAWGNTGPRARRRGFDSIVQAATGISAAYADTDGRPGALPVQALDHATGYGVVAAAVSLVGARAREGRVGHAHLSLARSADILFASTIPAHVVQSAQPQMHSCRSDYGELDFVLPPLAMNGVPITYPHPPHIYGSDSPGWLRR